jgi:hypothetical protein
MTVERELVEHFADVGETCATHGVLDDAFDELTDRLAIQGLWCTGEHDRFCCRVCGDVRNGHKPEPGCLMAIVGLPLVGWRQFRYHVLRRGVKR